MQVLVKNSFSQVLTHNHLHPAFWDELCFYMDEKFSIPQLFESVDPFDLSPYFFLDPRVAFLISQMSLSGDAFIQGLGPVATVAALTKVDRGIHTEDFAKTEKIIQEYLPKSNVTQLKTFNQIVVFGSNKVDEELWKNLLVGGFYLMGSITGPITVPHFDFEAFGKLWPIGMPTEIGWKFNDQNSGLVNFEFCKIKKLS